MSNKYEQAKLDDGKPSKSKNFWVGGVAGSVALLIGLIILPFAVAIYEEGIQKGLIEIAEQWIFNLQLSISVGIPASLCLGFPAGGIGGVIIGSLWKNKKAAIYGGVITAIILIPVVVVLFLFTLFGGFN